MRKLKERVGDRMFNKLSEAISHLACELSKVREQRENEFEWIKSHAGLATKADLKLIREGIEMKLSELKTEVGAIRTQVSKIWGEQQSKYDALVVEFDELKASLENAELPADVVQDIVDFKAELKAFDDTIPDVTA